MKENNNVEYLLAERNRLEQMLQIYRAKNSLTDKEFNEKVELESYYRDILFRLNNAH